MQQVAEDERFYRFYTLNETAEIFYNLITQDGKQKLETFLEQYIVKQKKQTLKCFRKRPSLNQFN